MYWGGAPSAVMTAAATIAIPALEWWQSLVIILGALGLSPAPWLLGMAAGKIQFTAVAAEAHQRELVAKNEAHTRELAARDLSHARELAAKDAYHEALMTGQKERYATLELSNEANRLAAEKQQARADELTDAVFGVVEVVRASSHVISAVNEVTQEVIQREQ